MKSDLEFNTGFTKLTPPAMPSLERETFSIAAIGGGASFGSFLAHLCLRYREFSSDTEAPKPPRIHITAFDPRESLGVGFAFDQQHAELAHVMTNSPLHDCRLMMDQPDLFREFGFRNLYDPERRNRVGEYLKWRIQHERDLLKKHDLHLSLDHEKIKVCDVSVQRVGGRPVFQIIRSSGEEGIFDALLVASGHARSKLLDDVAGSPLVVSNPYEEYEKFLSLIRNDTKNLIFIGFGPTAREMILQLKKEKFAGKVTVVTSGGESSLLADVVEGRGSAFGSPEFCYLTKLHQNRRFRFIQGRVVGYTSNGNIGAASVHTQYEDMQIEGAIVNTAPFNDMVDQAGFSPNETVRHLQDKGIIPPLREVSSRYTDRFGRVIADPALPPVFLTGRVALSYRDLSLLTCRRHAELTSWGVLQQAYATAWESVLCAPGKV